MFAILFEVLLIEIQEEIHHFAGWEGGGFRESFCESGEGVRLPRERADLRGSPGNFRGSAGNFRGSLGNFRGTPGLL